ncbi:MAG: SdrD B-like domain-containing protein [Bacillota bacterium]
MRHNRAKTTAKLLVLTLVFALSLAFAGIAYACECIVEYMPNGDTSGGCNIPGPVVKFNVNEPGNYDTSCLDNDIVEGWANAWNCGGLTGIQVYVKGGHYCSLVDLIKDPNTGLGSAIVQNGDCEFLITLTNVSPDGVWYFNITQTASGTGCGLSHWGFRPAGDPVPCKGSICGMKFNDADGERDKDETDSGIEGWTILLKDALGNVIDSQDTDANGEYCFEDLSEGTYTVEEVPQKGWDQTYPEGGTYTVTIPTDNVWNITGRDFGNCEQETPDYYICGAKFDADTEDGLEGWKIILWSVDGDNATVMAWTYTDADGNYCFGFDDELQLVAGTYRISEELQPNWSQVVPEGDYYEVILSEENPNETGKDFVNRYEEPETYSICGYKWNDLDGDGEWGEEPGLSSWTINLYVYNDETKSWDFVEDETTGENGNYCFTGLGEGTYKVCEVNQSGWNQTYPTDPNCYIVTFPQQFVLTSLSDIITPEVPIYNFGNHETPTYSICGAKWNDQNGNGIWEQTEEYAEPVLSGWEIRLEGEGVSRHVYTGTDGLYCFDGLLPGTYTVSEVLQSGWQQTYPASPGKHQVVIVDESHEFIDFGNYYPPNGGDEDGSICGTKFNDVNNNGARCPGEPGLPGWTIILYKLAQTDYYTTYVPEPQWVEYARTTTDGSGNYCFNDLPAGTYKVAEVQQSGWTQTYPASPGTHTVELDEGQNVTGKDFGNYYPPNDSCDGSISGMKFNDLNNNGQKDAGEPGLSGWKIKLSGANGLIREANTGSDGTYFFGNLGSGTYTVSEEQQSGWTQTCPAAPGTYEVIIRSCEDVRDKDFGNYQPGGDGPDYGSISGMKFNDADNNGAKDSDESGLDGWTIILRNSQGTEVARTTTSGGGYYSFTNLNAGTYTVEEVQQSGWTQTYPAAPGTHGVVIRTSESVRDQDFGNYQAPPLVPTIVPEPAAPTVETPLPAPVPELPFTGGNALFFVYTGLALIGLGVAGRHRF